MRGALALLLALGWYPLPDALLRGLEDQYAAPPAIYPATTAWWFWRRFRWRRRPWSPAVALGSAAERVVEPVMTMRRYPHLRVLFTGGDGILFGPVRRAEAEIAREFFDRMGRRWASLLSREKITQHLRERGAEPQVPGVDASKPWLLVTSRAHAARAGDVPQNRLECDSVSGGLRDPRWRVVVRLRPA